MTTVYPVALVVEGRRCLVVGGGTVAARKAAGLRACGADVRVVATSVGPEMAALGLPTEQRPYRRGEVAGYWLAIAATGDHAVNLSVFEDGEAAGVWVNGADDPAACSFMLPAVARRGPISVAVSTGGQSPALSGWLRSRFEAELGPEYEVLAGLLHQAREDLKAAGHASDEADWRTALDSDMLDLIRAGQIARAKERLQSCLSSSLG